MHAYTNGSDGGDNESMYAGHSIDLNRYTTGRLMPAQDRQRDVAAGSQRFGGPHSNTWTAAYCDGSVHNVSFEMESEVFHLLGGRADHRR